MRTPLRTLVTSAAIGLSLAGTSVALAQNDSGANSSTRQQVAVKIHQCLATYHTAVVNAGQTTVEARLALRACIRVAVGLPASSSSRSSSSSVSSTGSSVSSTSSSVSNSSLSSSLSSSSSSKSWHPGWWWWNNDWKDHHDNRDGDKHDKKDKKVKVKSDNGLKLGVRFNERKNDRDDD